MPGTAPLSLAALGRGSAVVTLNGGTFYTRSDIMAKHSPVLNPEKTSLYGQIDKSRKDLVIKLPLTLFGLWSNLGVLFPSYALNPVVGASIYPATDSAATPLVIKAKNGDRIAYGNAAITKLFGLYLGVDSEIFAAAVEVSCILRAGFLPTDSGAYFVRDTATYIEPGFSNAAFLKARWTGCWGSGTPNVPTGFGVIVPQKGFNVDWNLDLKPFTVDGYGTVDMTIGEGGMIANCKAIGIGPTMAQIDAASAIGTADMGTLLSAVGYPLTLTSGTHSLVLNNASLIEHTTTFGIERLRVGEVAWETTRGFSGTPAAPAAVATVA